MSLTSREIAKLPSLYATELTLPAKQSIDAPELRKNERISSTTQDQAEPRGDGAVNRPVTVTHMPARYPFAVYTEPQLSGPA